MDLIIFNGNVITVDRNTPRARAVAVMGGKIAAAGGDSEILSLRGSGTELLDLRGKTVVPGFNDSHMHLLSYALAGRAASLGECTGIAELTGVLKQYIGDNMIGGGRGGWVFGRDWDQTLFDEKRMPTREDLDRVSRDHCIVIMRTCGHLCAVNSRALREAGIAGHAPEIAGGSVDVDERGVPTGILKEKAMDLVLSLFPGMGRETFKDLIGKAAGDFLRVGLTTVQSDDLTAVKGDCGDVLEAYRELDRVGELPVRVNEQLLLPTMEKLRAFLESGFRTGDGSEFFKIGPLKLLTDGSLGGRTAFINQPYADDPGNTGIPLYTPEELNELVECAHSNGLQVAAHAIGDRAVEMVLDAFAAARRKHPCLDPRLRVIHASMVNGELLDRFRDEGIIADIQPSFVPSDMKFIGERLGPERTAGVYCWREFLNRGIPLGGGSDCPVETFEPLAGLQAAVTRQDGKGRPPGGWLPGQRLTVEEALEIFTLGSAYSAFEEKSKGSITPGKFADMVVLDEDICRVNPGEIASVRVLRTIVGGKTAYRCR